MKPLLPALLVIGLGASCASPDKPKFSYPVVVTADHTPIYQSRSIGGKVLVLLDKGDTLELDRVYDTGLCAVKPDADANRFKGKLKVGYIERRFLAFPTATLANEKAKMLRDTARFSK